MRKFLFQTIGICCCLLCFHLSTSAQPSGWSIQASDFANNMSVTAQVYLDANRADEADNWLGAFVDNEVRGVTKAEIINGSAYFFLTIFSNKTSGETVKFKFFHAPSLAIFPALEEIDYVKSGNIGGYPIGFAINASTINDFPISLLAATPDTTLAGYPFDSVPLANLLVSQDNDPVTWSVQNGNHIEATIGAGNVLTVTPNSNHWFGTDSIEVTATETGTPAGFAASRYLLFTVLENYAAPSLEGLPVQFVHNSLPLPAGDLKEFIDFSGDCMVYSFDPNVPIGNDTMPAWGLPTIGNSGSMNLTIEVQYGGKPFTGLSNKLAAFIDGHLAGTAIPFVEQGKTLFFLSISNIGKGDVVFQFYDQHNSHLYTETSGVTFAPSGSVGNVYQPFELDVAPISIDMADDGTWTTTVLDPEWEGDFVVDFFATDCEYGDKVGSVEMVFAFNACPEQTISFPATGELCLLADSVVQEVQWFRNGSPLSSGVYLSAVDTGVFQYQGLTPAGCPDLKSCPLKVTNATGFGVPTISLPNLPGSWPLPPNCYPRLLTQMGFVACCDEPVATCRANVSVQLGPDGNGILMPSAVDSSSIIDCGLLSMSLSQKDFDCSYLGNGMVVTLTIKDIFDRSDDCQTYVTVVDQVGPNVNCPADTTVNCDADYSPIVTGIATAADNCVSATTPTSSDVTVPGNCPGSFTVSRTWLSYDDFDNPGNCDQIITVQDTVGPVAACLPASVVLDNEGNGTIAPTDVFDTANSSDNCSEPVTAVAVSPSSFDCGDSGTNTVILTVEDACGNQSNCSATVTVGDFVVISSIDHTDETCLNMSDGSVTISATAPGGDLKYSIDGGINFSTSPTFNDLSPGSYNILVKAFGIANGCEATGSVVIAQGATPTLWYKDLDNDGFTDYVTQTGCIQPAGFKAFTDLNGPEEDCNDTKTHWFPGQIWYPDFDVDFYGTQPAVVQCSRPPGHRRAGNLIELDTDCDNYNAAINPGAIEICNGIDDNCNGEVDEGGSGGDTFVGNVLFTTQAQVDDFSSCYSVIDGNLTINGASIHDLSNLFNLTEVMGNLTIQTTGLIDLQGLNAMTSVGGALTIFSNSSLATLDGFGQLEEVGGNLMLYYNFQLDDCCAFYDLLDNGGVSGATTIFFNSLGCNSQSEIMTNCNGNNLSGHNGNSDIRTDKGHNGAERSVELRVFPNPTNSQFTIAVDGLEGEGILKIFDSTQRLLWHSEIKPDAPSIHIKELLPKGLYLLHLTTNNNSHTAKVIVK